MRQEKKLVFENKPKQVSNIINFAIISEQITHHITNVPNGQFKH